MFQLRAYGGDLRFMPLLLCLELLIFRFQRFFLRPLHQKRLLLPAIQCSLHIPKQFADLLQSGKLFFLPLSQLLMPLICPDVFLHGFNIRLLRDVTDVLCDKFLNIHNWTE